MIGIMLMALELIVAFFAYDYCQKKLQRSNDQQ